MEASWRRALRTSMNGLPDWRFAERRDFFCCGLKCLADAGARGAADDVVAIERGVEGDGGVKVFAKFVAELAQVSEREITELDTFFERKAHGIADFLVSGAEGHAFVNEVGGRGHRVQIAGLRSITHAILIELEGGSKPGHELEHLRNKADRECRLLGLLHVFIVGQRQAFELQDDGLGRAVNAANFGANEFGEVGIFLLRHGAGTGGKSLRQKDEAVFGGGEERDLFGKAAEMQTDECERLADTQG